MKYTLYASHVVISDWQRRQIEEKIDRLDKYRRHPYQLEMTFSHDSPQVLRCRLNYGRGRGAVHAEYTGGTLEDALDGALDALKRELVKAQEKLRVRR